MKTAEELLKEKRITPETIHHNYDYVYRAVCKIIEQAQKEAYNEALIDAAMLGKVEYVMVQSGDNPVDKYQIDKQSILRLRIEL